MKKFLLFLSGVAICAMAMSQNVVVEVKKTANPITIEKY